jgi:hypothetical protein
MCMQGLDCTQQPPLCNGFHVDLHNVHVDLQSGFMQICIMVL